MRDVHHMGVAELAALLKNKEVSAVEVATRFLARLGGNPHNAFLDINSEVTLEQARASDAKLAAGTAGPLEGVPIAHKDVFVTKGFVTTAGSKILTGYRSPFDATVVRKLREAGMVSLGKLNCDEFAMGSANENVRRPLPSKRSATRGMTSRMSWRVFRRQRGCGGGAPHPRRHGHGHRRLHPPTRRVLRHHRHQTHLWSGVALRHGGIRLQPGPGRADGAQCRRLRAVAVRHVRAGSGPGFDFAGCGGRRFFSRFVAPSGSGWKRWWSFENWRARAHGGRLQ